MYLFCFLLYILGKQIPRVGEGLELFKLDTLGNLLIPIVLLVCLWRRKREDVTEFFLVVVRNSGPLLILLIALFAGFTSLIFNRAFVCHARTPRLFNINGHGFDVLTSNHIGVGNRSAIGKGIAIGVLYNEPVQ